MTAKEPCNRMTCDNDFVIDENGVLREYKGHDTEIILPDTVRKIGKKVFGWREGYVNVEKITVPEGVTEIEEAAFISSELAEIHLPSSLKTIGKGAFMHCEYLRSIVIPDGVTEIAGNTFMHSHHLEEVHLPQHITRIGRLAFQGCEQLQKINLPADDSYEIGIGAFTDCRGLVDDTGLLIIQNRLFAFHRDDDGSLVEVDIPDTVTSVEYGVFNDYTWINITMPVHCPSWPVLGRTRKTAHPRSIISYSGCSLSFRGKDGEITAKVVLETNGEEESVENDFIVSIRCRDSGGFDFEAYDRMFSKLKQEYNRIRMALVRLRYPYELPEEMEEKYTAFLREHGSITGRILINEGDAETMHVLMQKKIFDPAVIPNLIEYAQILKKHDFTVSLLDYQNREFRETDAYASLQLTDTGTDEE